MGARMRLLSSGTSRDRFTCLLPLCFCGWICIVTTGCREPEFQTVPSGTLSDYEATMSVHELARELNMQVDETNDLYASLSRSRTTLVLFAGRAGGFYVNGDRIRQLESIRSSGGIVQVPRSLVPLIRQALPAAPAQVAPRPVAPEGPIRGLVILDPGHGGKDPGALGSLAGQSSRVEEKALNLQLARKVSSQLKGKGVRVMLTRYRDTTVSLEDRVKMANTHSAALFVSLHANSSKANPQAQGFQIYIAAVASNDTRSAAKQVATSFKRAGFESHGPAVREDKARPLFVLRQTRGPALLVETGFMSNAQDLSRLVRSDYQDRLAGAIAEGIITHLREQQGAGGRPSVR